MMAPVTVIVYRWTIFPSFQISGIDEQGCGWWWRVGGELKLIQIGVECVGGAVEGT